MDSVQMTVSIRQELSVIYAQEKTVSVEGKN